MKQFINALSFTKIMNRVTKSGICVHYFEIEEVLNTKIEPKCVHCKRTLGELKQEYYENKTTK